MIDRNLNFGAKMQDSKVSRREIRFIAATLLSIVILVACDLVFDFRAGADPIHLLVEVCLALIAFAGFVYLTAKSIKIREKLKSAEVLSLTKEREAQMWRSKAQTLLDGLSAAIEEQLDVWNLTHSEKDVARLLLKGFSSKEIATYRNTAEKTVRAQSMSIYAKSGLDGRSELSAFFLEDFLQPRESNSLIKIP